MKLKNGDSKRAGILMSGEMIFLPNGVYWMEQIDTLERWEEGDDNNHHQCRFTDWQDGWKVFCQDMTLWAENKSIPNAHRK